MLKKEMIMTKEDIFNQLRKKGYMEETIKIIGENYE